MPGRETSLPNIQRSTVFIMTGTCARWIVILCVLLLTKDYAHAAKINYKSPTVAEATNDLAYALQKVFPDTGNLVFSPWAIAFSLSMVLLGANGETLQEMRKAMFMDKIDPENVNYGFKQLREHLMRFNAQYEMDMFCTVLVQQKHNISPVYKLKLQRYYDADIHDVNFAEMGERVLRWLNAWTSLKTSGKIEEVMTDIPDQNTVMMLVAVNYFKGVWEEPFDGNLTKPGLFFNEDGSELMVDMMTCTKNMTIYTGDHLEVEAVDLPMKGDISFVFMMPEKPEHMSILQNNLSRDFFDTLYTGMSVEPVELGLPKFRATGSVQLEEPLEALGMSTLFSQDADLTRISNDGQLSVQHALHKASLEIDEQGAVATSVTVVTIVSRIKAYKLHFNRPFIFAIRDRRSDVILFMGRISEF